MVCGAVVSGDVPSSAYAIVGPIALRMRTAMTVNESKDVRALPDIAPPLEIQIEIQTKPIGWYLNYTVSKGHRQRGETLGKVTRVALYRRGIVCIRIYGHRMKKWS